MDSSFWKHLNPKIVYDPTRKQYFGKYCYKLVLQAYGGRSVGDCSRTVEESLQVRKELHRHTNWGGSWHSFSRRQLDQADVLFLEELKSIKNGYGKNIKVRVEEPWAQIYSEDEETLKTIALRFAQKWSHLIISVSTPESIEQEAILKRDSIIIRSDSKIGYTHKVLMRDGMYQTQTKQQLYQFLLGLGDAVKLSKATNRMLSGPMNYIWGCYFYTNDPSIDIMINIIRPGTVGKIHRLETV